MPQPKLLSATDIDGPPAWRDYVIAVQGILVRHGAPYFLGDDVLYSDNVSRLDGRSIVFDPTMDSGIENCYAMTVQMPNKEGYYLTVFFVDQATWDTHRADFEGFPDAVGWSNDLIEDLLKERGEKGMTFIAADGSRVLVDVRFGALLDEALIGTILEETRSALNVRTQVPPEQRGSVTKL